MSTFFNCNFELAFEFLHPDEHEMHVLEHAPVAFLCSLSQNNVSVIFLTLTHGNVGEGTILAGLVVGSANLFDIGSWVNTREKHEECSDLRFGLFVEIKHIK